MGKGTLKAVKFSAANACGYKYLIEDSEVERYMKARDAEKTHH